MTARLTVTRTFTAGDTDMFTVDSTRPLHEAVEIVRKTRGVPGATGLAYDCRITVADMEQHIVRVQHSWTDTDQTDLLDALEAMTE